MDAQGYGKYIAEQIRAFDAGKPITTEAVAEALAAAFGIGVDEAKKITNVNLKRLADKGEIARVRRGVYGKTLNTLFGKLPPNADEMMTDYLLHDGGNIIGFLAGPTLLNAIGLSTLMPRERHIATNRYRYAIPDGLPIRVHKPVLPVTDENEPYLQTLDAIVAMNRYPVDAEQPEDLMRDAIAGKGIANDKLIWFARNYYDNSVLLKTIDITLGKPAK
jgi:hypothetical protein